MSPLKISLLLRCYCQPAPNQDISHEQAFAPSMVQAVEDFQAKGILKDFASPSVLRFGTALRIGHPDARLLTDKGERLALCIISATEYFYLEEN